MNTTDIPKTILFRVGVFTLLGLALIGALTVFVNDKPFWWRKCQLVHIFIDDANGLKYKSPVRSLGLQIGYLNSVELKETKVRLGICITAPVEVLDETVAFVKGEGILGDKYIELKPVRYVGDGKTSQETKYKGTQTEVKPQESSSQKTSDDIKSGHSAPDRQIQLAPSGVEPEPASLEEQLQKQNTGAFLINLFFKSAVAADEPQKEVRVGESNGDMDKLMQNSDRLVKELTDLTKNLKEGLNPAELRQTIQQLNKTLDHASKALAPEGNLNSTARRSLQKLESAFDQLNQQMTRINKGEGSLGRIINDPVYADELLKAAKNLNKLLNKVTDIRFLVNLGAEQIPVYDGGRGFFQLGIWPSKKRYYLIGITIDPRGRLRITDTTTTSGGTSTAVRTQQIEQGGILLTGMLGIVFFDRLDLSAGALHGDGAASIQLKLGPKDREHLFTLRTDLYTRGQGFSMNQRVYAQIHPLAMFSGFETLYVRGGLESFHKVNGKTPYLYGAGVTFDDEDIKLLFSLR